MTDLKKIAIIAIIVAIGFVLYWLSPVLTPFLFSALLAYLTDPLADRLEKFLPRGAAVAFVFLLLGGIALLVLMIIVPLLERQIQTLVTRLPTYVDKLQTVFIPWITQYLGSLQIEFNWESLKTTLQENWSTAGNLLTRLMGGLSSSGIALIGWAANLLLIPVITFYLLRDWGVLLQRIRELLPRRYEQTIVKLAQESDSVLSAFLRGQLLVMMSLALIYSAGLWWIGLDFSLLIGSLAGLVSFVPYLGFLLGFVAAAIVALFQFQDTMSLIYIVAVFGVGQLLEGFLLTPYLVGDRIGLHPVAVIFAVMAGGQLFGFFGVLLALPVAAVVMVLLRHAHERYVGSAIYSRE